MNKFIATSCEFSLIEDDWNEGEGKTVSVWNEEIRGSDTIKGVLKNIPYLREDYDQNRSLINGIFENDPVKEGDYSRFDGDLMVDYDDYSDFIEQPTHDKWEKFKKGEVKLYNLHIAIYIKKIMDLNKEDIDNL